jgi:hypothetical protein
VGLIGTVAWLLSGSSALVTNQIISADDGTVLL